MVEIVHYMAGIVQLTFESLFELFKRPENAYVFALLLIVFGIIVFAFAVYLYLRRSQPLKKLNKLLAANIKREDFAANFNEIDAAFYDTDKKWGHNLSHAWAELKESLVHENEEKVVWNTARPHNYIDAHDIRGPRILSSFPNIFVGLGLVFTFLGLAASLQGISIDGDVAAMQKGLQNVLSAASVKFTASITGLVMSIFLGSFIRFAAHSLDKQIELVNEHLERGMRFVTSEELAYKQLQQLTEQTAQLQNFNATLAADVLPPYIESRK
ncbi:MAG: hypothetical protein VX154_05250 [Pseudomonadota bacterium]|nr:hypothetical protein [Pseudomonadota bacterium]